LKDDRYRAGTANVAAELSAGNNEILTGSGCLAPHGYGAGGLSVRGRLAFPHRRVFSGSAITALLFAALTLGVYSGDEASRSLMTWDLPLGLAVRWRPCFLVSFSCPSCTRRTFGLGIRGWRKDKLARRGW